MNDKTALVATVFSSVLALTLQGCGNASKNDALLPPAIEKTGSPEVSPSPEVTQSPSPSPSPSPSASLSPAPETVLAPTKESIQKDLVDKQCVMCHQEATERNRFVKLTNITEVIKGGHSHGEHNHSATGPRTDLIIPGCPDQSMFLVIMREGKMPKPPTPKISDANLATIAEWILNLDPTAGPNCDTGEPPETTVEPGEPGG